MKRIYSRNWLMQFWRLISLKIYSRHTGIRRTSGRVLDQNSAGLRLKKGWCSVRVQRQKNCCLNSRQSGKKFPLICKRWVIFFFFPLFQVPLLIGWNLLTLETATYFTQMPFWCLAIIQPVAYLLKTCYKYKYISSSNIHFKIGHKGNKKICF